MRRLSRSILNRRNCLVGVLVLAMGGVIPLGVTWALVLICPLSSHQASGDMPTRNLSGPTIGRIEERALGVHRTTTLDAKGDRFSTNSIGSAVKEQMYTNACLADLWLTDTLPHLIRLEAQTWRSTQQRAAWPALIEVHAGYPFHCFTGHALVDYETREIQPQGAFLAPVASRLTLLPYRPDPIALAANVALYSLPVFLWIGTVRMMRRKRTRAGRCAQCGYLLGDRFDLGCPECGCNRVTQTEGRDISH